MSITLFVSHSTHDKPIVREITKELPGIFQLWFDEDRLAFDQLRSRLQDAILQETDLVLAFLSAHSRESQWVRDELGWAHAKEKELHSALILPILLDATTDHPGLPDLAARQYLRVTDRSKLGIGYHARTLERMIFTFIANRYLAVQSQHQPRKGHLRPPSRADPVMGSRILIVRHGGTSSKQKAIRLCSEEGLKPTVIDSFGPDFHETHFEAIDSDPLDWNSSILRVESNVEDRGIFRSVITFEELDVVTAARIGQYLGCTRRLSVAAAKRCRDKFLTRESLKKFDVPQVRFCVAASASEAKANISDEGLCYPLVVKPRNGAASIGVERVDNPDDLEDAFARVRRDVKKVRTEVGGHWNTLDSSTLIVEEYIQESFDRAPREVSVEGVVSDGQVHILAIHQKLEMRKEPPFFEPVFISPPLESHYSPADIANIAKITESSIHALDIDFCPFHAELRMGRNGPVLLEIGARPGGGIIPESIYERCGADIRALAIKIAADRFSPELNIPRVWQSRATCLGIVYPKVQGRLERITGVTNEELKNRTDVFIAYPLAKTPQPIVQQELTWLLDVGIRASTPEMAYARFCEIRNRIKYIVDGNEFHGEDLTNAQIDL